jgi:tetratricopeptide (TPR) repeat protein
VITPLCSLAVVLAAGAATTLQVGEHTFHWQTLDNGLQALAVDDGDRGSVSVFVVYAAGTRCETAETTGLAHLVEHCLYTGTARTSAGGHDRAIQLLGGESNAYTRDDYTVFYDHLVPATALVKVLGLEADRMRGLTWSEPAFLHERERLRVEEAGGDRSDVQLGGRRDLAMWGGRGYGSGILDAEGHSRGPSLELAQARAFYDAWYHPRNAAVVVVGGDPAAALEAIAREFGRLPRGPAPPAVSVDPPAERPAALTIEAALTRDRLEWVWVGPSLAQPIDRAALHLLAELLDRRTISDGSPVDAAAPARAAADLFVLGGTGPEAAAGLEAAWRDVAEVRFDDAALEAGRARILARLAARPLRARPYFSLAVEVATAAALGHAQDVAADAFVVSALGRDDLRAAAARWLAPAGRTAITWRATTTKAPLPDDAEGLKAAAEAAEASGDLERAIEAYERLITLGPGRIDLVIFRYSLGGLFRRLGRLEEARRQLLLGLEVVEYPAVRDLLNEVEAELAAKKKD